MANIFDTVSEQVFKQLKQSGRKVTLFDDHGQQVYTPKEARKFFTTTDKIMVVIEDDNIDSSLSVMYGANVKTDEVIRLISKLRVLASRYNLLFNVKQYGKRLSPKDFAYKSTPLAENSGTIKMNQFKLIKLANADQLSALTESLAASYEEGVDFSTYGNSVIVRESYQDAKRFLKESFGILINESPDNNFVKYALAWSNSRARAAGAEEKTSTSKDVVDLATGLAEIASKKLYLTIKPTKSPQFRSVTSEIIYKLDKAIEPGAGITGNNALWIYISAIIDKLQHGNKIDKNEEFFAKRLIDLVDSKLGHLAEAQDGVLAITGDAELTELARKALIDIKNECSEQNIALFDTVNSAEEFSALLVGLICQKLTGDVSSLMTDHFEDFSKIVAQTFPEAKFNAPEVEAPELPEMKEMNDWINESYEQSDDKVIANIARRDFNVDAFFKEWGTDFWLGSAPGEKGRSPAQVIPFIAMYVRETFGLRSAVLSQQVAEEIFNQKVKPALEKKMGFVFEAKAINEGQEDHVVKYAEEYVVEFISARKGFLKGKDASFFKDGDKVVSEVVDEVAADVVHMAEKAVDEYFEKDGTASVYIRDDKSLLALARRELVDSFELNETNKLDEFTNEGADASFYGDNDKLYLSQRRDDWKLTDIDNRARFFPSKDAADAELKKRGFERKQGVGSSLTYVKTNKAIPGDVGQTFKDDIRSDLIAEDASSGDDLKAAVAEFVKMAEKLRAEVGLKEPKLEVEYGKRYARIATTGINRSVFCFVDMSNGDILKSASWKAPAKGARGSVLSPDHGQSAITQYGAKYAR